MLYFMTFQTNLIEVTSALRLAKFNFLLDF